MICLPLRLVGPMQSWGLQSRFTDRDTGREPSKSGVVGLLCAALGRDRSEPVDDLAALRMGVRVDREGEFRSDYHTAMDVPIASDPRKGRTVVSRRHYLADAAFLVALAGDPDLLARLDRALADPVWNLCLGRRSFPPSEPIRLGAGPLEATLEEVLASAPPVAAPRPYERDKPLRTVVEVPLAEADAVRPDQPVSFAERRFAPRGIRFGQVPAPGQAPTPQEVNA